MRHLLLIRHSESIKNVEERFTEPSVSGGQALTDHGIEQTKALGKGLVSLLSIRDVAVHQIYSSISERAILTARILATEIGVEVSPLKELNSIGSGILSGKTETEASRTHPAYIDALYLYRTGLLNSYDIPIFPEKEDKTMFEERVSSGIKRVLDVKEETVKIVISHRSPITATLINFARRFHSYPREFFGHVQLDLGLVSWIEEIERDEWRIRRVNTGWNELLPILQASLQHSATTGNHK